MSLSSADTTKLLSIDGHCLTINPLLVLEICAVQPVLTYWTMLENISTQE